MIKTQFSRFLVVGLASTFVNYATFLIFYWGISLNFIVASCFGYILGLLLGYYLNRSWTFELEKDSGLIKLQYFFIYIFSLSTGLALLNVLVVKFSILIEIANIIVICYTTISNFLGIKFLVFKK